VVQLLSQAVQTLKAVAATIHLTHRAATAVMRFRCEINVQMLFYVCLKILALQWLWRDVLF
jgi:hypothetical protein